MADDFKASQAKHAAKIATERALVQATGLSRSQVRSRLAAANEIFKQRDAAITQKENATTLSGQPAYIPTQITTQTVSGAGLGVEKDGRGAPGLAPPPAGPVDTGYTQVLYLNVSGTFKIGTFVMTGTLVSA